MTVRLKKYFVSFLVFVLGMVQSVQGQTSAGEHCVFKKLDGLENNPEVFSFTNNIEVNNNGGHLQGIQKMEVSDNVYFLMTGSSDSYSYIAVVDKNRREVVSVKKLLDKPFKHAGGFQISGDLMAVGIEDNSERKRSKVYVWKINDPLNIPEKPLKIIERSGEYERATAGCVAITEINDKILIVVGDWDTEHLDFYVLNVKEFQNDHANFKKVFSITAEDMDRSEWINEDWGAYQNINLLQDSGGNLYLAGLSMENDENVFDLFMVIAKNMTSFDLIKVYSKKFVKNDKVNFDWGAGVYVDDAGPFEVLSCPGHLRSENDVFIFK